MFRPEVGTLVQVEVGDAGLRHRLHELLTTVGYQLSEVPAVADGSGASAACVLLDYGSDLAAWKPRFEDVPVIAIVRQEDVRAAATAMKHGAFAVLTRPLDEGLVLVTMWAALDARRSYRRHMAPLDDLYRRFASLTLREREVFAQVVDGRLNKQIAGDLGVVEKTVKLHRGHVMRKMQADSLAALTRMWAQLPHDGHPSGSPVESGSQGPSQARVPG